MCDASISEVQQTQMTRAKDVVTKGSMKIILDGARVWGDAPWSRLSTPEGRHTSCQFNGSITYDNQPLISIK